MNELAELTISRSTIESISGQEIGSLMVGFAWKRNLWRHPRKLIRVSAIQIIGAAIVFMLAMIPIDRLLNIPASAAPSERTARLILVNGVLTLGLLGGINGWILLQGKKLARLLELVENIDRYNQIVRSIAAIDRLANLTTQLKDSAQITTTVLTTIDRTRQRLLTGLEIERLLRQQSGVPLASGSIASAASESEQYPVALEHLTHHPYLSEYAALLDRVWEIGLSVDRSLTKP